MSEHARIKASKPQASRELATRIASALVLAPLALGAIYLGGFVFAALAFAAALMMFREWMGLVRASRHRAWLLPAGIVYASLPALALVALRNDAEWGLAAVLLVVCAVWACDSFAYVSGRLIGGPKLAPSISPGKTWAGLAGGVAAAGLVGAIVAALSGGDMVWLGIIGAVIGVVSQAGDLLESALKRHAGVKDAGALIPGHGGLMDRLDGLWAAAPAAWLIGFTQIIQAGGGNNAWAHAARGLMLW